MTKQQRIEAFNEKAQYLSIEPDRDLHIKGKYMIEVYIREMDSSFVDWLIKELTEAKEIMEMKDK